MSTIFWSARSVLLREPGGEEGVTTPAAQDPELGWGGREVLAAGTQHSPACRTTETLREQNTATHVSTVDSAQPLFLAWVPLP